MNPLWQGWGCGGSWFRGRTVIGLGFLAAVLGIEILRRESQLSRLNRNVAGLQAELDQLRREQIAAHLQVVQQTGVLARSTAVLDTLGDQLQGLDSRLEVLDEVQRGRQQDAEVAKIAAAHSFALGVAWRETSGKENWRIYGTGFLAGDGTLCVTAGHVIQELVKIHADLQKRGLAPKLLAVTPAGRIVPWSDYLLHPSFTDLARRPRVDLGAVRWDHLAEDTPAVLTWADADAEPATVIVAAGYPVELTGIVYPPPSIAAPQPTVKFGRVERTGTPLQIPDVADSAASAETLQHNLAVGGGFSGAPILNPDGEAVGVITWSSHLTLSQPFPSRSGVTGTVRFLNAAGGHFALPASIVRPWIEELITSSHVTAWISIPSTD